MINISEKCREEDYGFFQTIRSLACPDCFLAENVADYLDNFRSISWPIYRLGWPFKVAYFSLINVGLTVHPECEKFPDPTWFTIHDATGYFVAMWTANHPIFPCNISFEQAREEQGLKPDDWVYEVFFRLVISGSYDVPSICEVTKFKSDFVPIVKEKERKRIRILLPAYDPV